MVQVVRDTVIFARAVRVELVRVELVLVLDRWGRTARNRLGDIGIWCD